MVGVKVLFVVKVGWVEGQKSKFGIDGGGGGGSEKFAKFVKIPPTPLPPADK